MPSPRSRNTPGPPEPATPDPAPPPGSPGRPRKEASKGGATGPSRRNKRRGRPSGAIKLSPQSRALLIAAVEAGGTDHACARAAGIDPRTYRTWRAIAEGRHPTRKPTPELRALFDEIDVAGARSRIKREIDVANRHPRDWLKHRARSQPGLEGWTEPVPEEDAGEQPALWVPTEQEFASMLRALAEATGLVGPCADPGCPCPHRQHEEEKEEDDHDQA